MSEPAPTSHQVPLLEVQAHIRNIVRGLSRGQPVDEQTRTILDKAVRVRCVECGIQLSTDDLIVLAGSGPDSAPAAGKVARLQQGYCARNGCRSYFYEVIQLPCGGIVWGDVMAKATTVGETEEPPETAGAEVETAEAGTAKRKRAKVLKLAAVAGTCLALLIVRQWMIGGRIPLLREPQKFDCGTNSTTGEKTCSDPNCPVCARLTNGQNAPAASAPVVGPPLEIPMPEE